MDDTLKTKGAAKCDSSSVKGGKGGSKTGSVVSKDEDMELESEFDESESSFESTEEWSVRAVY